MIFIPLLYRFIAIEQLRFGKEDSLRVLISSEQVYFLGRSDPDRDNIVLQVTYAELYHCRSIALGTPYHLNYKLNLFDCGSYMRIKCLF